jgi:hypothetical protein
MTGQSRKRPEFISRNSQKILEAFARFFNILPRAKIRILGGNTNRAFSGVADAILLTTDGDH